MTFGEKLASLRKQANLTQSDLADKLNISRQAITKWENGTGLPDLDNIKKLSSIFNTSIDELLDYKTEEIKLELDVTKETINRENSKWGKVNEYILNKFKNADSIEMLSREKKLTFWQHVIDIFITPAPGTLEIADLIGTGMVYSFLVKENSNNYLVLVNKTKMLTKKLEKDFEKNIVIDGYKYSKFRNNKLKQ
ncbi:MAG: helix-turn-helix transcriptional regulator [Clostridia bacterium]|nr:helix-turn-helix transcriptional regulator [Clostridia bacterium]